MNVRKKTSQHFFIFTVGFFMAETSYRVLHKRVVTMIRCLKTQADVCELSK